MIVFDLITIFPEYFESPLSVGTFRIAIEKKLVDIKTNNLRDYTEGVHRQVDDTPYGGGHGMVMKPEPFFRAVKEIGGRRKVPKSQREIILLSPRGETLCQSVSDDLSTKKHLIILCGRYEGVDERVREKVATREISCGDYILSGGEAAALVLMETIVRLVPGVLGEKGSLEDETFNRGMMEYPQYTRPSEYEGHKVPEVLLSGNHEEIKKWRLRKAIEETEKRSGKKYDLSALKEEELKLLGKKQIKKDESGT